MWLPQSHTCACPPRFPKPLGCEVCAFTTQNRRGVGNVAGCCLPSMWRILQNLQIFAKNFYYIEALTAFDKEPSSHSFVIVARKALAPSTAFLSSYTLLYLLSTSSISSKCDTCGEERARKTNQVAPNGCTWSPAC